MRITREILLKLAQDTVARQVRADRSIMAAYLCGSLLGDEYMLGGTVDIDLFLVHVARPEIEREIVRLTDDIHLDIAHHDQADYRRTRELRVHPWIGPTLSSCTILYDPQHFLDFTQASVRGQFDRPDRTLSRARKLLDASRQIWFSYHEGVPDPGPQEIEAYFRRGRACRQRDRGLGWSSAHGAALLDVIPAARPGVGASGLIPGFAGVVGWDGSERRENIFLAAGLEDDLPGAARGRGAPRLHPDRLDYYLRAFEAILESEKPLVVLWPLLRTWTLAASLLPAGSAGRIAWAETFAGLNLLYEAFVIRVSALDAYLDLVDETMEGWGRQNGVW